MSGEKRDEPSYEELADLVARQRQGILELHELVERQEATIARLQKAATSGRRWKPGRGDAVDSSAKALGVRVEAILELAKREAEAVREEARRGAAELIASAEREAARILGAAGDGSAGDGAASEAVPDSAL